MSLLDKKGQKLNYWMWRFVDKLIANKKVEMPALNDEKLSEAYALIMRNKKFIQEYPNVTFGIFKKAVEESKISVDLINYEEPKDNSIRELVLVDYFDRDDRTAHTIWKMALKETHVIPDKYMTFSEAFWYTLGYETSEASYKTFNIYEATVRAFGLIAIPTTEVVRHELGESEVVKKFEESYPEYHFDL
jgi:hypothetical protein